MKNSHLDRRTQYSLNVIRQALFDLLEEKPLESITVADVCRTADINRGTFYKYYRDVPDLYDKIEDAFVDKIHALLDQKKVADGNDRIFFHDVLTTLTESSDLVRITKGGAASGQISQKLMLYFIPYVQEMTRTYRPGISELESNLLTEYIIGGCTSVVTYWLKHGMSLPIQTMENTLTSLIKQSLKY